MQSRFLRTVFDKDRKAFFRFVANNCFDKAFSKKGTQYSVSTRACSKTLRESKNFLDSRIVYCKSSKWERDGVLSARENWCQMPDINAVKMQNTQRSVPNILITGTPGVGKSTISKLLAEKTKFTWREVSKLAEEHNCLDEYDPEYQCPYLNEDKLLDIMEGMMAKGGNIVDYHGCDFFPERWFDGVFVIRTNNTALYDRLTARGYTGKKLEDNIQCEIFETLLEEAQSSYKPEIVKELQNDTEEQMLQNVQTIIEWIERWKEEHL